MMKTRWIALGLILIGVLGAGCATTGEHNSLASEVAKLKAAFLAKADQTAVDQRFAAEQARTAAALTSAAQAMDRIGQQAKGAEQSAANAHSRLNLAEQRLGRADQRFAALEKADEAATREIGVLKKGVAGSQKLASSAHKKAGVQSYLAGPGRFLVTGFPSCRFDKEDNLVAGTELSSSMKKMLDEAWNLLQNGYELEQVVGFADERPFRDQPSEKSDELNQACALARAEAVRDYLELGDIGDQLVVAGPTTNFGELAANRAVLVEIKRP